MTGRIFLTRLGIPSWFADKAGIVTEVGDHPCPISVGKSCFPKEPPCPPCGITACKYKRKPEVRFFYRLTEAGYLCIAYPYLHAMPDPFGVRRERVTRILNETTELLLRLCLHPRTAELEWLHAWKDRARLSRTKQILSLAPESIPTAMLDDLLARSAEAFERSEGQFLILSELPIGKNLPIGTCFVSYLLLCAVLLVLSRADASRVEVRTLAANKRPEIHLRARIDPDKQNEVEAALEGLRAEASCSKRPMRLQIHVENRTALVRLHDGQPLREARVRWKWLEADDGSLGKWYAALLLLAHGIASLSFSSTQAAKEPMPSLLAGKS